MISQSGAPMQMFYKRFKLFTVYANFFLSDHALCYRMTCMPTIHVHAHAGAAVFMECMRNASKHGGVAPYKKRTSYISPH